MKKGVNSMSETFKDRLNQALNVSEAWLMGYDVPMERLMYEKNAAEVELLEQI